jgi:hypothetical protein
MPSRDDACGCASMAQRRPGLCLIGAFDRIVELCGVKYDKAVACLQKDRDALLAFYDFPAEHWKHLRTTNPIESTFATMRHRTIRSKGCLSNKTALAMLFKLVEGAQKTWRRLDGQNMLPKLIANVKFQGEIEASTSQAKAAARPKRPSPKFGDSSGTVVRALIFGNPPERPGLLSTSRLLTTSGPALIKLLACLADSPRSRPSQGSD